MKTLNITPQDMADETNAQEFVLQNFLRRYSFIDLVIVVAVDKDERTVDVKPLTLLSDMQGNRASSRIIYGVPYFRIVSGGSAIVIDPTIGDIGIVAVCDKDISHIKNSKSEAVPATTRMHNLSDSIYFGGVASLSKEPQQFIRFDEQGIHISTPQDVNIEAKTVYAKSQTATLESNDVRIKAKSTLIDGDVTVTKNMTVQGKTTTSGLSMSGGGEAEINGSIRHTGDYTHIGSLTHTGGEMTSLGRKIDGDHVHNVEVDKKTYTTETPK